jgi:molybdenum cofactor cytidylyltransferase
MRGQRFIGELFEKELAQWGLRGDPYLWREMRRYLSSTPLPGSASLLRLQLEQAFLVLTGKPMGSSGYFYVEKFAHGGMSSGGISPECWRERLIPLLMQRYLAEEV